MSTETDLHPSAVKAIAMLPPTPDEPRLYTQRYVDLLCARQNADIAYIVRSETVLTEILGWIEHWRVDIRGNLKPTQSSLDACERSVRTLRDRYAGAMEAILPAGASPAAASLLVAE